MDLHDEAERRTSSGGAVDLDLVAADLRTLAGLRTRTAVRDRHLAALLALLPADAATDRDLRYRSIEDCVGAGLAGIRSSEHRQAATALFGFDAGRWRPLNQRGAEAAGAFGLGWDAYRRRRPSTGASLLDETIQELARAVVALDAGASAEAPGSAAVPIRPDGGPATAEAGTPRRAAVDAGPLRPPPGRRRRPAILAALAAVALAAAFVAAAQRDDRAAPRASAPDGDSPACELLQHRVGEVEANAGPDLRRWAEPFAAATDELDPVLVRCAGTIELDGDQIFQRISGTRSLGVGALVAGAGGPPDVVALDTFEFPEFRDEQLEQPSPTARLGTPVRRADREGLRVVEFTSGVLVREQPGGPAVPVVQRTWERWLELGGLDGEAGRPLSARYGVVEVGDVQEFEGGDIVADFRTGELRWEPITEAERRLPDDHRGSVLVTRGGDTSWLVGADGVRHWLPTEADFACATRSGEATLIPDVRGAAIARLPAGAPSRCR